MLGTYATAVPALGTSYDDCIRSQSTVNHTACEIRLSNMHSRITFAGWANALRIWSVDRASRICSCCVEIRNLNTNQECKANEGRSVRVYVCEDVRYIQDNVKTYSSSCPMMIESSFALLVPS